jgi:hypothetical protein
MLKYCVKIPRALGFIVNGGSNNREEVEIIPNFLIM